MLTENPLASNNFPKEAETMPFPKEEVTPPVTKIYLVGGYLLMMNIQLFRWVLFGYKLT